MKSLITVVFLLLPLSLLAQSADKKVKEGNKLYEDKKYNDAEISYRKSLEIDPKSYRGKYNLGDAQYKQNKYDEAAQHFLDVSGRNLDKETLSKAYHNLGNSLLQSKKYQESIDAYKMALRNNPSDMDTKYNLEYARRRFAQQQEQQKQQQQQQNKNGQNNQQQQQQQNKDDQKKDDQNKQNQQNQQQQQQQQKQNQQQQQQQQPKISKEDANRILQALNDEEKNVQKKLQQQRPQKSKLDKNW